MRHKLGSIVVAVLSLTGLGLSSWVWLPAPTRFWLFFSIGAPEVSPWLVLLNLVASVLALRAARRSWLYRLALGGGVIGFCLSLLPLAQLPGINERFSVAMRESLGSDYLARVPQNVQAQMREQPFNLPEALIGIQLQQVRYTPDVVFATHDGTPLKMHVYRPVQMGTNPTIIVIYGGAWQTGGPGANPELSRYMAARGYTVFAIDYRHAPRYRFPAQIEDVRAALRFIRDHAAEYEADVNRMALLGRSSGAHLAMLAAYEPDAPPVRAVVSYYGPTNLAGGYADPPNPDPIQTRDTLQKFIGGSPAELPEQYRLANPISYVRRSMPPTLFVHGGRDNVVELRYVRQLYEQMHAADATALLLEIPLAGHSFDAVFHGPSNQLALYYIERFLAWALQGDR